MQFALFAVATSLVVNDERVKHIAAEFPFPPLPGTAVDERVKHIAESVYQAALEDFRAHRENAQLRADAAALQAKLDAVHAQSANHSLFHKKQPAPIVLDDDLKLTVAASTAQATPRLAAFLSKAVEEVEGDAAAAAARRVLAQACDDAVASSVLTAHQITEQIVGAEYAGPVAEEVRVAVRDACMAESEVMANQAIAKVELLASQELPQIVKDEARDATHASAMQIAEEIQYNRTLAAIANGTMNASALGNFTTGLNGTLNGTVNGTLNATNGTNDTNGSIYVTEEILGPEAVAGAPIALAPPGPLPSVNITIGNITIESGTAEPLPPTLPPNPPRLEEAIDSAIENAEQMAQQQAQVSSIAMHSNWTNSIEAAMRNFSALAIPPAVPPPAMIQLRLRHR